MEHEREEGLRESEATSRKVIRFQQHQISKETGSDDIMEEYANELAIPYTGPTVHDATRKVRAAEAQELESKETPKEKTYPWLGAASLTLAILAMFVYPTLFGAGATLLGFLAYMAGNRALGVWSIVLGLIALAGYFLLVPLYA
jgi:hypothetical protein